MTGVPLDGGLEKLEIVSGMVFGFDDSIPEPPHGNGDARTVLERSLLGPLQRSPCAVAFSGGRDSSAVLAAATVVARRNGLPEPVPLTFRFPGVEDTDETDYQEAVIRHLGISEWMRLEPGDALDVLGEASTSLTARHGLLYPGNIHFLVPVVQPLRGGALLTGVGGDEILDAHPNHDIAAMLLGRRPPSLPVARQLAKRYLRRERIRDEVRTRADAYFRWLVPSARHELITRMAAASTADLLFASRHLRSIVYRMRYLHRASTDMAKVAADFDVELAQPFLDGDFVGAVADGVGRMGYATRREVMVRFFGDVLPRELTERTSKARFDDIFWTGHAAGKVADLPVEMLSDFVDEAALRELWASDEPKGNTFLIVKYLWEQATRGHGTHPGRNGGKYPIDVHDVQTYDS